MKTALAAITCLLAGIAAPLPAQEVKIATVNTARILEDFAPWQEELQHQQKAREQFEQKQREKAEAKDRYLELIKKW